MGERGGSKRGRRVWRRGKVGERGGSKRGRRVWGRGEVAREGEGCGGEGR